jgi:imidazolonepropionase
MTPPGAPRVRPADFVVHNLSELLACAGPAPRRGPAQAEAQPLGDAVIAADRGTIAYVAAGSAWREDLRLAADAVVIDAHRGSMVPGFVDAHTHVVFAGDRRSELRRRLAGETYAQIAAQGGGILESVRATRGAASSELETSAAARLNEMLRCGTTTAEVKSGYGLDTDAEMKMLQAIRSLGLRQPIELVPTFLGAHDVPADYRHRRTAFVDALVDEMIPAVARSGLAEWCDAFCDAAAFTVDEARRVLAAGARAGLKLRLHADELARNGGAQLAAELQVRSVDHVVFADDQDIRALADSGVVATLLPIASLYLKLGRFAPARELVDAGVPVALGTDVNPAGGFSPSMPFAMTLACFAMGLSFEEALVAATINAAYSVDRHDTLGSLEPGKQMDAVIIDGPAIDLLRVGADPIRAVIKKGRVVHERLRQDHHAD